MKLCVILPVYNAQTYLPEALQSLADQSFKNFKILAVNDCSTDNSGDLLEAYAQKDPRMEIVHFEHNQGENNTMNYLLDRLGEMNTEYAALMHNDDISQPFRFARQVAFFRKNPKVDILGTSAFIIDSDGKELRTAKMPTDDAVIKANMAIARGNLLHPSTMWRNDFFRKHHIRYGEKTVPGDFDMWVDCAMRGAKIANLSEVLFKYRVHANQQSRKKDEINATVQKALERYMTVIFPALSAQEVTDLASICHFNTSLPPDQVKRAYTVAEKVVADKQAKSVLGENRQLVSANIQSQVDFWKKHVV